MVDWAKKIPPITGNQKVGTDKENLATVALTGEVPFPKESKAENLVAEKPISKKPTTKKSTTKTAPKESSTKKNRQTFDIRDIEGLKFHAPKVGVTETALLNTAWYFYKKDYLEK